MASTRLQMEREDFLALLGLMAHLPDFEDAASRRAAWVTPAFMGYELGQAAADGMPLQGETKRTAAAKMAQFMIEFGQVQTGVHALGAFLRHLAPLVGAEDAELAERLIDAYTLLAAPRNDGNLQTEPEMENVHYLDDPDFRWERPEMRALRDVLARMYATQGAADNLLGQVPFASAKINWNQAVYEVWRDILKKLHGARKLHALIQLALKDEDQSIHHRELRNLIGVRPLLTAGRVDEADFRWRSPMDADVKGLERLKREGRPDWLPASFLDKGARVKRAVAHITAHFKAGSMEGTGFLIGEDLLLTCHHVLFDTKHGDEMAESVEIRLGYERTEDNLPAPSQRFKGNVAQITTDKDVDWAVIRLFPVPDGGLPRLPLGADRPVAAEDRAYILQHPYGREMQLSLHGNLMRHTDEETLQYLADTEQGSSGAPVFNDRWEVVGLHRRWAELYLGADVYRNEAVNIRRVMQGLLAQGIPFTAIGGDAADAEKDDSA